MTDLTTKVRDLLFPGAGGVPSGNTLRDILEAAQYTLTEHDTGELWVDGKMIFRQIATFDTFSSGLSTAPFNMSVIGVDTIVRLTTSFIDGSSNHVFSENQLLISNSANEIRFNHGAFTLVSGHAIIEYTKL